MVPSYGERRRVAVRSVVVGGGVQRHEFGLGAGARDKLGRHSKFAADRVVSASMSASSSTPPISAAVAAMRRGLPCDEGSERNRSRSACVTLHVDNEQERAREGFRYPRLTGPKWPEDPEKRAWLAEQLAAYRLRHHADVLHDGERP